MALVTIVGDIKVNDWCYLCGKGRLVTLIDPTEGMFYCSNMVSVNKHPIPSIQIAFPEPSEDRFPHKCQACGGKCYVGLNVVEHPPGVQCR